MLAAEAAGNTAAKVKRLSREVRDLQRGKNALPLQPAASIFLRHDADRMDMMRACITGLMPASLLLRWCCFGHTGTGRGCLCRLWDVAAST